MKVVFIYPLGLAILTGTVLLGCQRSHNVSIDSSDEIFPQQRLEKLGRLAFFDESLSEPAGESCATCHDPAAAFTDPRGGLPTSRGAVPGDAGVRNTPTAMYAAFVPPLHYVNPDDGFAGGLFLDGRVDSLEAQAQKPLTNPIEMGNADDHAVAVKLRVATYADLFRRTFGDAALDDDRAAVAALGQAIAAFERRRELAPFSSKFDAFLAGRVALSPAAARGLAVFEDEQRGPCSACHPSRPGDDGTPPLFTDFTYDNLGIPKNAANPYYTMGTVNPDGAAYVDHGLQTTLGDGAFDGMFRVPTLRNIALTAPYGHNGYFADLRSIVDFYNTRDQRPWPAPEVAATMNRDELGQLGLSDADVDDLIAFLYTLTDGYAP
ncbi:MAG: cytochrome-c peroxidase [Polyangia bacterium]